MEKEILSENISVAVKPSEKKRLEDRAEKEMRSVSNLLRAAGLEHVKVQESIEEEGKKLDAAGVVQTG